MQGRIQLPATSTHYDHGAQPRTKVFDFFPEGGKLDSLGKPYFQTLIEKNLGGLKLDIFK